MVQSMCKLSSYFILNTCRTFITLSACKQLVLALLNILSHVASIGLYHSTWAVICKLIHVYIQLSVAYMPSHKYLCTLVTLLDTIKMQLKIIDVHI